MKKKVKPHGPAAGGKMAETKRVGDDGMRARPGNI